MPYVELPGVHLWYNDTGGSGTPVVFMHAASGTCESWVHQLPVFTAAGYRCITYDRRGWGRSRPDPTGEAPEGAAPTQWRQGLRPRASEGRGRVKLRPLRPRSGGERTHAPTQSHQQPGYLSDDLQGLADHLGLGRFHIAATAAGGIGGLDYTLAHPERVRSLVVANSIGGVQDPEYLEVQHRLRPPEIQALPIALRELGASYRGINPEGTRRWIEIEHASRQAQTPGQPPRNRLTFALLETIRIPVLMLVGEADLLSPPALMRMLAAHIPNCRFVTVPEAGHAAFWEQPEIWNRVVLEFMGQY